MEIHFQNLQNICRFCGSVLLDKKSRYNVSSLFYKYPTLANIIFENTEDRKEINPPFVCYQCKRKLDSEKKRFLLKRNYHYKHEKNAISKETYFIYIGGRMNLFIIPKVFDPHTESCKICFSDDSISEERQTETDNEEYDKQNEENTYNDYNNDDQCDKREDEESQSDDSIDYIDGQDIFAGQPTVDTDSEEGGYSTCEEDNQEKNDENLDDQDNSTEEEYNEQRDDVSHSTDGENISAIQPATPPHNPLVEDILLLTPTQDDPNYLTPFKKNQSK